jgi:tetratricopeptide (TPR) repeat protein
MKPDFVEAWNNLGTVLADLEEHEEALKAFRKTLQLDPLYIDAHYNLADTLDHLGRDREARPHWKEYLRHDATSCWAHHARSRLGLSG